MPRSYRKTDKGQAVIQQRLPGLTPRQRTLLLLCDGKRPTTELLQATAGLGCDEGDLAALLQQGCVEVVVLATPAPPPSRPVPVAAAPAAESAAVRRTDPLAGLARAGIPQLTVDVPDEALFGANELHTHAAAKAPAADRMRRLLGR